MSNFVYRNFNTVETQDFVVSSVERFCVSASAFFDVAIMPHILSAKISFYNTDFFISQ